MNSIFAKIIDNYALFCLHLEKSKQSHFLYDKNFSEKLLVNDLFFEPKTPDIKIKKFFVQSNYEINQYTYKSEIISNENINNLVKGLYYKNTNINNKFIIILINGWRMKFSRMQYIFEKELVKRNYDFYYFNLPYHYERKPNNNYNGELTISANVERTIDSIRQAVIDLRSLIKYFKKQDKKVILLGISLGGLITNLACVVEKNIDLLISHFYANNLAEIIWNTYTGKYIKRDFLANNFLFNQLDNSWKIIKPSEYQPVINKNKILLLNGIYDHFIIPKDTDVLWESWGKPRRILYKCGHSGIVLYKKKILKDILLFINDNM